MQKVSELSHTLELQGFEIDDLRKENQNLIQTVSEMKRTLCPSRAVTKDSGNKADNNLEGNSDRQHPGIIRKGLLMRNYITWFIDKSLTHRHHKYIIHAGFFYYHNKNGLMIF